MDLTDEQILAELTTDEIHLYWDHGFSVSIRWVLKSLASARIENRALRKGVYKSFVEIKRIAGGMCGLSTSAAGDIVEIVSGFISEYERTAKLLEGA